MLILFMIYIICNAFQSTCMLLIVTFLGESKVIHGFSTVQKVKAYNPHIVQGSTILR